MSRVTGRKKRIIITTAAMMAVGTGAAFAFWSAAGTTTVAAVAGKSVAFKVSSTVPVGGALTPDSHPQSAEFTIKNENTGVQNLSGLVVKVANADGTPWASPEGCSAVDFLVSTPTFSPGSKGSGPIQANATVSGKVTIQMRNLDENQDRCQGVSVPLHFAAS
jgi:hypothetical protein